MYLSRRSIVIPIELPDEALLNIASCSGASVILSLACACKSVRAVDCLVAKRFIPCSAATADVFAAASREDKDDIAEYIAAGEVRRLQLEGDVTFDTFCDMCRELADHCELGFVDWKCGSYRFLPQCVLNEWRSLGVPNDKRDDAKQLLINQQFAFFKLARRFPCPSAAIIPAVVIDRYNCASRPAAKAPVLEIRHVAGLLLQGGMFSEAALLLQEILLQEPTCPRANYELGMMHACGDGVAKDEQRAVVLLGAAAEQQCPLAACELGCLHWDHGELALAQFVFERGLLAACASREDRTMLERNLSIVRQRRSQDRGARRAV